jgi:asparagine synthetase B (glutamine-hydrolysing)
MTPCRPGPRPDDLRMNDFLIQFGRRGDARALAAMLRDRPGVATHPVHTWDFAWGRVAVQPPVAPGYAPLHENGTLVASVGRPRFVGVDHEQRGRCGFNALFRERLLAPGPAALGEALTGMFAAVECGGGRVRVLTDQMGFMPVYVGHDPAGRVAAVGTHADSVAKLAGRETDFDPVSLGDLLVNQHVTFPYTTRRGVTQLGPAGLTEFPVGPGGDVRAADVRTTVLWQPAEPDPAAAPPVDELEGQLEAALRAAAADVARGAQRVALTLSGGLDSRLVLCLLRGKNLAGAVTYATRDNREVDVARRVARAAGVPHQIAWRGEEFYAELMPRAVALLGTELRGECHGFALDDNGIGADFDLIVGGFMSDTLFKGHYMPEALRQRVRRRSPYDVARRAVGGALRAAGVLPPVRSKPHFWDVARGMACRLRPEVRDAIAERQRVRLEQVRAVRPESAEEWARFWPASRADGAYGPQANTRLFTADELFMHRGLVELAARVPMREKLGGHLAKRVFARLYGALGEIENANTGLRADADPSAKRPRNGNGNGRANGYPSPTAFPWNDVPHSWVDYELLQKHSPTWSAYRTALARSPALDVLDTVLTDGVRPFVAAYHDDAGFLFNRAAMQLAYAIDRTLADRAPPPVPEPVGHT